MNRYTVIKTNLKSCSGIGLVVRLERVKPSVGLRPWFSPGARGSVSGYRTTVGMLPGPAPARFAASASRIDGPSRLGVPNGRVHNRNPPLHAGVSTVSFTTNAGPRRRCRQHRRACEGAARSPEAGQVLTGRDFKASRNVLSTTPQVLRHTTHNCRTSFI